jgi:hypothetical protein
VPIAPTGLSLKLRRRRSIKTTSAAVAHAIAVNIPDPSPILLDRLGAVDTETIFSRRCAEMQGNASKKDGALTVDRIGGMFNHGRLVASLSPSNVTR